MKEKDIAMNALLACRHMADLLHTFGCEASSDICDEVKTAYDAITQLQHNTYDMMVKNDWMQVEYETKSKLEKAYGKAEAALYRRGSGGKDSGADGRIRYRGSGTLSRTGR